MPCFVIRARCASSVRRVPVRRSIWRKTAACPGRASGYPRSARVETSSGPSARCVEQQPAEIGVGHGSIMRSAARDPSTCLTVCFGYAPRP